MVRLNRSHWLGVVLLCLGMAIAGLALELGTGPICPARTVLLDGAEGLQIGDAVYLADQRVGEVVALENHGRRVAITVLMDCQRHGSIAEGAQLYLWNDPRQSGRKSLRLLLSPTAPERQSGGVR